MVKKKSKMLKKIMAFFLATLILCSSIPMQVFAAGINLGQQVSRTTINVDVVKKYGHQLHTTKVNGETYPLFCIEYGKSSPTSSTLGSQGRPSDKKLLEAARWIFCGYYMEHGNAIDYLDMAYCQKKVWAILGDKTKWTFSNEGYEKWCNNAEKNMKDLNTYPSFDGDALGPFVAGNTYTINDNNKVLDDYPAFVQDSKGIRIEHKANSNSLTISIDKNCTQSSFSLLPGKYYKTMTGDENECLLYNAKAGGTQKLMYSAYYDPIDVSFRGAVVALGNVELTKEDRFNGKIDGAKFGIYTDRNCTNRVATAVSKDGKIVFDYLEPKTYFIKEISAPKGFLLSDTVAEITVRSNQTSYITINNDEPTGKIELTKELDTSKTNSMHGDVNINGAEYTLYADEDIKSAIGSKTFYNKGDVVQVGKVSSNSETIASCTFDNLPLGKYMLKETKAPEGTLLDKTEYKIELKYKDQTTEVILNNTTSTDAVKSMKVQIFKSGSDGSAGQVQGLEGAEFTIKLKSDYDNAVKQGYKTEEIWSFKESTKWFGINDKNEKVEVDGTKAEKAQEIAPTYDVITTNKNGFAVSKYLPYGKYIVKETKTPVNYTSGTDFTFSVKNDETEFENVEDKLIYINVNNAPIEYPVKIVKKDKESGKTVSLNSAKFKIKATENIYNTTTGQIVFAKGNFVEYKIGSAKYNTFMTNSDNFVVPAGIYGSTSDDKGTVTTPFKLPAGHYEIVEFETPQGFLVPEEKYEFEISTIYDYDQDQDGDTVVVVEVENSQPKGNVNLQKSVELRPDVDTSVIKVDFTKVKFELVAAKDIIDMADGQVIYKAGDKVGEYSLDAEGKLSIKNLWIGEYYLQEVETMEGAVLDDTKYSVIFTAEDTTTKEYTVNLNVVNKTTEVDITKVDVTGSNEIEGTELVVYDKAENVIDKWTSGKEAHKIEGLVVGNTYILHEEYAPNGYTIATDIEFTVGNTSEIQKVNMIDKQVAVTKVDENNKALAGAELVITNVKTKQIVDKWTSTEELHYVSGLIEGQTYILAEVQAPYGYEITKEIEFTVTQDKELQTIQMQDTPIYASVQVEKVDAQTGENIKSNKFEFTIFADEQCTQEIKTVNANTEEGTALFEKLTYGTYYIKETKAPKGYELSDEVIKIDINDKGVFANGNQLTEENGVYSFKYQNSLLPIIATGDNPMMYVYVAGVLILGVALIVLIKKKVGKNNNKK